MEKIPGYFPIVWQWFAAYFGITERSSSDAKSGALMKFKSIPIENPYSMSTLVGLFFSVVSIFGLVRCQTKRSSLRKIVLVAFSAILILAQVLFMSSVLEVDGQEFIAISGIFGGIILILSLQKNEHW
jgi:hypothetical protein